MSLVVGVRAVVGLLGMALAVAMTSCSTATPEASHAPIARVAEPAPLPDPLAGMTLAQQVGQLFMVGTTATAAEPVTLQAISGLHVGNVFLSGRSHGGVTATAAVVQLLRAEVTVPSTNDEPLLVATDQEGGEVQVLQGPGFLAMPTGVVQSSMGTTALGAAANQWADELAAAGVNMNLAPVVDLVPSLAAAPTNPPIGIFQREIGFTPSSIVSNADTFSLAMAIHHVIAVRKHFPGLGHVNANTDTAPAVSDTTVTATGPDMAIYRSEIVAGAQCIMVSSAVYVQLDAAHPAVFSSIVVTGLLRHALGFTGVVMSDDLSAAAAVSGVAPGDRAIDAISSGVDLVLISSRPELASVMVRAVLAKAQADPAFAKLVSTAARRVVRLKNVELPAVRRFAYPNPRVR